MSWSTQNIYDYVVNHLRTGNTVHGSYRNSMFTDKPCFCAKGCLLQIKEFGITEDSLSYLIDRHRPNELPSFFTEDIMNLLNDLEWVWERCTDLYDSAHSMRTIIHTINYYMIDDTDKTCYKEIASRYNLTYKPKDFKLIETIKSNQEFENDRKSKERI